MAVRACVRHSERFLFDPRSHFQACKGQCWAEDEIHVHKKECLENDRKSNLLAAKKIECHIDVLLHDCCENA